MKKMKIVVFYFVLMVGFFNLGLIPSVQAQYLGDFCLDMQTEEEETYVLKLGVYHIGGGHGLLSGSLSSGGVQWWPVHGNLEFLNGALKGTLVVSCSTYDGRSSMVIYFQLDPTTLNGTFNTIATEANCPPGQDCQFEQLGDEGTLTTKLCP